jgi:hypothetical protein
LERAKRKVGDVLENDMGLVAIKKLFTAFVLEHLKNRLFMGGRVGI